jgi:hypothetical protein
MNNSDEKFAQLQNELDEIKLKLSDEKQTKKSILNPVNVIVIAALIGLIGNGIVKLLDWRLEKQKFQSSLVLKSLERGDTTNIHKMLMFLINTKLLEDKDSSIRKTAMNSEDIPIIGFNVDPEDLPTITVSNSRIQPCRQGPIDGCWKPVIEAIPGDTISLQLYFKNSGDILAEEVSLYINPKSSTLDTLHIFVGGVASLTLPRSEGFAIVKSKEFTSLTFIPGSVRILKNGDAAPFKVLGENSLFDGGFKIGDVSPGIQTQGALVAQFKVSGY